MIATEYDNDNIFAKILREELPCHKVYEDDATLAFMDIMPRADGHTLVIPKNPSRNMLDAGQDDINAVMATVQKIAKAQMTAFEADGITIQQFNDPAGGQVVFHLHMHVIPRKDGITMRPHTGNMAENDILATHAQALINALEKNG
ncbi:MAG TPA: HIT family protein [Rhizobiales bacterium]|nr:HIT family protein [Hyphomicrobiales bacterium]